MTATKREHQTVWICDNPKCDHARKDSSLKNMSHLIESRSGERTICSGTLREHIPQSRAKVLVELSRKALEMIKVFSKYFHHEDGCPCTPCKLEEALQSWEGE